MNATRLRFVHDRDYPWSLVLIAQQQLPDGAIVIHHTPQKTLIQPGDPTAYKFGPLLEVDRKDPGLQDLMDNLWELGFRPRDIGTAGHLAATQEHLKDMKSIAFKFLGLNGKGEVRDA